MSYSNLDLKKLESKIVEQVTNVVGQALGVTPTNAASSSQQESQLLTSFRALDQDGRDKLLSYAEELVDASSMAKEKENAAKDFNNLLIKGAMAGERLNFK